MPSFCGQCPVPPATLRSYQSGGRTHNRCKGQPRPTALQTSQIPCCYLDLGMRNTLKQRRPKHPTHQKVQHALRHTVSYPKTALHACPLQASVKDK